MATMLSLNKPRPAKNPTILPQAIHTPSPKSGPNQLRPRQPFKKAFFGLDFGGGVYGQGWFWAPGSIAVFSLKFCHSLVAPGYRANLASDTLNVLLV